LDCEVEEIELAALTLLRHGVLLDCWGGSAWLPSLFLTLFIVLLPVVVCKSFVWSGVVVSAGGRRCWRAVGCVPSPRSFGEEGTKCRCARRSAVQGTVKEIGARSLRRAAICFAKALARSEAGLMLPPASSRKERGAGRRPGS